jgi:hypothetical protein
MFTSLFGMLIWKEVDFYVPEAYLTHFTYRCWFLYCPVQRAVWVGGAVQGKFTSSRQGGGRGGERDEVNLLSPAQHPSPLCILPSPPYKWGEREEDIASGHFRAQKSLDFQGQPLPTP